VAPPPPPTRFCRFFREKLKLQQFLKQHTDHILTRGVACAMAAFGAGPVAPVGTRSGSPEPEAQATFRDRAMFALRSFVMYAVVMQLFGGFSQPRPDGNVGPLDPSEAPPPARLARPLFTRGEPVDAFVYVTYDSQFEYQSSQHFGLVTKIDSMPLSASAAPVSVSVPFLFSQQALDGNHTPYLHVVFSRTGKTHDPGDELFLAANSFVASAPILRFYPRREIRAKKKLLQTDSGDEADQSDTDDAATDTWMSHDSSKPGWVAHFNPNVTVSVVDDFSVYKYPRGIPETMRQKMRFEPTTDAYFPTAYVDDFWVLRDALVGLFGNASGDFRQGQGEGVKTITMNVTIAGQSVWRWQTFAQMEQSFAQQRAMGTAGDNDADQMKRVLLDGNPKLLVITGVVSFAHLILETLAFKSDVTFWKSPKKSVGVSARTIVFNLVSQVIILLYLLDNDTSWMVLLSNAMGVAVDAWKISRVLNVRVTSGFGITFTDKRLDDLSGGADGEDKADGEGESATHALAVETAKHDETAMRYLIWLLIPLLFIYAVYSVFHQEHKGWYSFVVTTLVGAVYAFGFLTMLPQLFINCTCWGFPY
jgi:hypothetical protein